MLKEINRYVKFWAPGSFGAEDWTKDVTDLDPKKIVWPDNAYAFTLWQREDILDGETRFKGEAKQIGPTYYHPESKVETLEQARKNPAASRILIRNMERNGWQKVVWSRWGNWPQTFDPEKDAVL